MASTSHYAYSPLPLPASANPEYFAEFGRRVEGFDASQISHEQMTEIIERLYKHSILLFKGLQLTPKQQYELTHAFDPESISYGHGNNKTGKEKASILHPDLKTIPHQPQVQLIGNGKVPGNHEGLESPQLKHPHHKTFHKTPVSEQDEEKGVTRFYRWHIDAALYALSPPKVTTLFAVSVPSGDPQTCRYDDGTGDEIRVPLGGTVCTSPPLQAPPADIERLVVSGKTMFDVLNPAQKSLAVRTRAPHPYVWMSKAHALPTGLGIENEHLELPLGELPEWEDGKIKCWKNPVTGNLHVQVHPCGAQQLLIDPLPASASRDGALYPDGDVMTDLKEVRKVLYSLQRPGIAPEDWEEGDLVLFHNRGLLHSVVGAFTPDQLRMFHQCNLAASDDPVGPNAEDMMKYA